MRSPSRGLYTFRRVLLLRRLGRSFRARKWSLPSENFSRRCSMKRSMTSTRVSTECSTWSTCTRHTTASSAPFPAASRRGFSLPRRPSKIRTCIVISHDAAFLNSFTQGVLYLDVHKHKVEQYMGNYSDVLKDITARVEKENMKNAQFEKNIIANKEKASFFANKGGKMRLVAKKMRLAAEEMEESKVNVRREDKTIRAFTIPVQENLLGEILKITSYTTLKSNSSGSPAAGKPKIHKKTIVLKKNQHLLLMGPNGIGKSTLLESIANKTSKGVEIGNDVVVGYYRQDFANLNFEATVFEELI